MMSRPRLRGRGAAIFAAVLGLGLRPAVAEAAPTAIQFAPHRAVYEVSLKRASPSSGIADLSGRMVYELTGNACEGYAQNFRYVTVETDHEGVRRIGDFRSTSWEDAAGRTLRFHTTNYQDNKLASATQGEAGRKQAGGEAAVDLVRPAKRQLSLAPGVLFPMQHSAALLGAAEAGKTHLAADLYDGSERGDKVSQTTAIIGRQSSPGAIKPPELANGDKLRNVASWPVSIGFFETSASPGDAVPTAEQSYRYYANGVSTDLVTDFGDRALRFDLKQLTFLEEKACEPNAARP